MLSSGLSVGEVSVSQTVYAVPGLVGSAVVEFLSVSLCSFGCATTVCTFCQVCPPSLDVAAETELRVLLLVRSKDSADAYAVLPDDGSLAVPGPNETQGSDARW